MQITAKTDAQTEARAIAPLTLEGAIWHYMDQKAVAAYGPWITKADHDAAIAAKDAELEAVRANRTDAHGWLFNNPDTGIEWLEQHPIESGEVPDAENVRPASAEEVVTLLREAWNALAAERAAREAAEAKLAEARKALAALDRMSRGVDWCDQDEQARRWSAARRALAGGQEYLITTFEPAVSEREPVAWRWKPKDSEAWIYDPKHEWLEAQSRDEIDAEPLYASPPTSELEELRKRVAELKKALEPFALVAEHDIGEDEADSDAFRPMPKPFNHAPQITVGHFRAARRVLEGGESNE